MFIYIYQKAPVEATLTVTYLQFPIQVCFPCICQPVTDTASVAVTDTFLNSSRLLIVVAMCVVVVTTMKLQERLTSTEFELHSVNHRLLQLTATTQHADDISCRQVHDGCMPRLSVPQIDISTIIKTTSVCDASGVGGGRRGSLAGGTDGLAGDGGRGLHATVLATQEQTLSGRGARVYTAHRGWLGVVTGISAASTGGVKLTLDWMYKS